MNNYFKDLEVFKPIQKENFIEITVPIVTKMNNSIVKLYITTTNDGYKISDDGLTFEEFSFDTKHYFNIFMEKNVNRHFKMQLDKDTIFKEYPYDFNIEVAVNEFARFFTYLDDFIIENNLT
ncbi:MAG: hypothetical protein IJX17_05440 [Clostridia bacterium]|nr:hypothetical protein [Clostridia bacterium]